MMLCLLHLSWLSFAFNWKLLSATEGTVETMSSYPFSFVFDLLGVCLFGFNKILFLKMSFFFWSFPVYLAKSSSSSPHWAGVAACGLDVWNCGFLKLHAGLEEQSGIWWSAPWGAVNVSASHHPCAHWCSGGCVLCGCVLCPFSLSWQRAMVSAGTSVGVTAVPVSLVTRQHRRAAGTCGRHPAAMEQPGGCKTRACTTVPLLHP